MKINLDKLNLVEMSVKDMREANGGVLIALFGWAVVIGYVVGKLEQSAEKK